jgi:hypothetical protein
MDPLVNYTTWWLDDGCSGGPSNYFDNFVRPNRTDTAILSAYPEYLEISYLPPASSGRRRRVRGSLWRFDSLNYRGHRDDSFGTTWTTWFGAPVRVLRGLAPGRPAGCTPHGVWHGISISAHTCRASTPRRQNPITALLGAPLSKSYPASARSQVGNISCACLKRCHAEFHTV